MRVIRNILSYNNIKGNRTKARAIKEFYYSNDSYCFSNCTRLKASKI